MQLMKPQQRRDLEDATSEVGRVKWARKEMADESGKPLSRFRFDQLRSSGKGDEDTVNRCASFLEREDVKAFIKAKRAQKKQAA